MINLSATILTESEINVLSKGLHFSPTKKFNLYNTLLDVNRFAHSQTLRRHFFNQQACDRKSYRVIQKKKVNFVDFEDQRVLNTLQNLQQDSADNPVMNIKKYLPPGDRSFYPFYSRSFTMDAFQDLIERDLVALHENNQRTHNNLNKGEFIALKNLSANNQIIIKATDKGEGGHYS